MRMRMMMAAMFLPLAACASTVPLPPPPPPVNGPCSNDGLDRFVGQKASADIGAQLLTASGAKTLRWGGPGMAMTMDFRPDRLTVSYDEAMTITAARCG